MVEPNLTVSYPSHKPLTCHLYPVQQVHRIEKPEDKKDEPSKPISKMKDGCFQLRGPLVESSLPLLDLVTSAESLTSLGKVSDKSLRAFVESSASSPSPYRAFGQACLRILSLVC